MADIVYSNPNPGMARFRMVTGSGDLHPVIAAQPKFRRANPDGGFISVLLLFSIVYFWLLTWEASVCVDDAFTDDVSSL
jgi:hypothetical protein